MTRYVRPEPPEVVYGRPPYDPPAWKTPQPIDFSVFAGCGTLFFVFVQLPFLVAVLYVILASILGWQI